MDQFWLFRTKLGKLGLLRKTGNTVKYFINDLTSTSGQWEWNDWVRRVNDGSTKGNVEHITIESISYYFLFQHCTDVVVELAELEHPGYFYPRIARENINLNYVSRDFQQDIRAFNNIQNSLDALFNYIEPSEINFLSFGHKIRELLILACTEVEYLLKKMLIENGYKEKHSYKTSDYIKCKEILKLNYFEIKLNQYPQVDILKPFSDWDNSQPTTSLSWYDAYNAVKHNRGDNIAQANLKHLLNAVAAIHILLESQYGLKIFTKWESYTEDRSMFYTVQSPNWNLKEITAPILDQVYKVKINWIGSRKYFEDFPEV